MARAYASAELTGRDKDGMPGITLWADDGQAVAVLRIEQHHQNLEKWMIEMILGRLVDEINDTCSASN